MGLSSLTIGALALLGVAIFIHAFMQAFTHHGSQRQLEATERSSIPPYVAVEALVASGILIAAFQFNLRFEVIQRGYYASKRTFAQETFNADFITFNHRVGIEPKTVK